MAALADGDIELDGYVVPGIMALEKGGDNDRVQDALNPVGDNLLLGRDHKSPPVWGFSLRAGHGDAAETLQTLSLMVRAWEEAPSGPGDESVLRYAVAGRTRRVFGRARNFLDDPSLVFALGRVVATAEFHQSHRFFYADEVESVRLSLIPGNAGGLVSPLVSPLTTVAGGQRQGLVTVGGDAPAPMEVTFRGPLTNPAVASSGWYVGLNASLAYDQSVTIDTRRGTVARNDGASLAGQLTRRTYLPEARLGPGARELIFTGTDATGTGSCTVSWRSTFYSF